MIIFWSYQVTQNVRSTTYLFASIVDLRVIRSEISTVSWVPSAQILLLFFYIPHPHKLLSEKDIFERDSSNTLHSAIISWVFAAWTLTCKRWFQCQYRDRALTPLFPPPVYTSLLQSTCNLYALWVYKTIAKFWISNLQTSVFFYQISHQFFPSFFIFSSFIKAIESLPIRIFFWQEYPLTSGFNNIEYSIHESSHEIFMTLAIIVVVEVMLDHIPLTIC